MASIPLPALNVRTPEQPDVLQKYGQLMQLKNLQQQTALQQQEAPLRMQALQQQTQAGQLQIEQQQQALKNQQALTQAYQKWDGKDYNDLAHYALQAGASGDAVQALQQHALSIRKTASEIAASDATTGSKNVETTIKQNGIVAGAIGNVLNAPDDQIAQKLLETTQQLAQQKRADGTPLLDAQHLQLAQNLAQQGPAAIKQALPMFQKDFMALNDQLEAAQKQAQAGKENADAALANLNVQRGGSTDLDKFESDYLKAKGLPDTPQNRMQAFQEYTRQTKIAPAEVRSQVLLQTPTQVYNPQTGETTYVARKDAIGQVAPSTAQNKVDIALDKSFTSGDYSKQLNAINTAREHMKTFNQLSDALSNGNMQVVNKIGNELGIQFGSDKATNFRIASQAFGGEVGRAFDGAGVVASERAEAQKSYSENMSPGQFKGAIKTVDALLAGKQTALKQTYDQGKKGQPNFGNSSNTSNDPFAQFGGKAH